MPISTLAPLQLGQLVGASGSTLLSPTGAGTVTPTANALVLLLVYYKSAGTTVPTPVQPSWAAQAWTEIAVTAEVGSDQIQVGAWWTIATSSPGAAQITINFSADGRGAGGGAIWEVAAGYNPTTPIRQFKSVSAASIAGNASLTDTFTLPPRSTSQLIEQGMAAGNATQFFANPTSGWTKNIGTDEGATQTSYVAIAAGSNGSTYGGDFGDSTTNHDHNNGAVFLAVEVQESAGAQVSHRNGIPLSSISALNGIAKAGISAVNGLTI